MTFSPVLGELNYVIQKKVFLGSWKTIFSTEDREKFEEAVKMAKVKKNKKALEDFKNIVDLVRSREDVYKNKYNNFFIRGYFTVDEEENFAKSWEQYLKDGKAPDKAHAKLFRDFRKNIFDDMHLRSEKRNYEFYEDLEVKITPERKQFFDILIIGKRLKKESIIIKILEWYIYISVFAIIIKLINDHIIKIY